MVIFLLVSVCYRRVLCVACRLLFEIKAVCRKHVSVEEENGMNVSSPMWRFLLFGIATVPLLAPAAWSAQVLQRVVPVEKSWTLAHRDAVTSVFKVDNFSCEVCLNTIGSELQGLQGTFGLEADLINQVIFVDHRRDLSGDKVAEKITAAGYPAHWLGSGKKVREAVSAGSAQKLKAGTKSGCNSRTCGATASEWKQLFHRYFAK